MTILPNPTLCKKHVPVTTTEILRGTSPSVYYKLEAMHDQFIADKQRMMVHNKEDILILGFNLIGDCLYQSFFERLCDSGEIIYQKQHLINETLFSDVIGYSIQHKSLTMSILDKNGVIKAIVIRHALDSDGDIIKWKTYGSKKYVPSKILEDEDFVFLYSGMAELMLVELFGFSYIGLQSDSMVKHLPGDLAIQTQEKVIVLLQDNDDSFKNIVPTLKNFFSESHQVITINFEKLLKRKLRKGYDFRDFCNEIGNAKLIKDKLRKGIRNELRS